MSKLSSSLKALISAPFARPNTLPASPKIRSVYERLRQEASSNNVGRDSWLTLSVSLLVCLGNGAPVDAIETDGGNYDHELAGGVDGIIQPRYRIERQDASCANCGIDEGDWTEMYRVQWGT